MAAGIATEENSDVKRKGYNYLCVSRTKQKEYKSVDANTAPIEITDI